MALSQILEGIHWGKRPNHTSEVFNWLGQGLYNVRAYGALGNGVDDDTNAIQKAINACYVTGGTVIFPVGTYQISKQVTLKPYVSLVGQSIYTGTTLRASKAISGAMFLLDGSGEGNTLIQDMKIDGNHLATHGIEYTDTYYNKMNRVTVINCTDRGLYILGPSWINYFDECQFITNGNGIYIYGVESDTQANGISFSGCFVYGNTAAGVRLLTGTGIRFRDCCIENNGTAGVEPYGLYQTNGCNNLSIQENYFGANGVYGDTDSGIHINIAGDIYGYAIAVDISHNHFYGGRNSYAIQLERVKNVKVSYNDAWANVTGTINYVGTLCKYIVEENNYWESGTRAGAPINLFILQDGDMILPTLTAAPASPINGQLVYADGTTWDPGKGEGFYGYESGAWVRIAHV